MKETTRLTCGTHLSAAQAKLAGLQCTGKRVGPARVGERDRGNGPEKKSIGPRRTGEWVGLTQVGERDRGIGPEKKSTHGIFRKRKEFPIRK